jgi:ribosomal protein L40E
VTAKSPADQTHSTTAHFFSASNAPAASNLLQEPHPALGFSGQGFQAGSGGECRKCTAGFTSVEGSAACNITIVASSKSRISQKVCMTCSALRTQRRQQSQQHGWR